MTQASKLAALLALLAAAAVGVYLLSPRDLDDQLGAAHESKPAEPEVEAPRAAQMQASRSQEARASAPTERRLVDPALTSGADAPQGIRGRVVEPSGAAAAGAKVFLVPSFAGDPITMMAMAQRGVVFPPVARGVTGADGSFALGVSRVDELKAYELRVLSDRHVDALVPNLRIQERDWYDAGTIRLARGTLLQGVVRIAGTNLPVAGAEIAIKTQSGIAEIAPTPGRERGVLGRTDAAGAYRIENAPAGIVAISAVAPGYARTERRDMTLDPNAPNLADFELQQGLALAGQVVDAQGAPIENAKITAVAISTKTQIIEEVRSDSEGRFEVIGLIESPYQLTAAAPGYNRADLRPIDAGRRDVVLTLEKLGLVKLQVYGKSHRLLSHYTAAVKSVMPGQGGVSLYGNTQVPIKNVRAPKDGIAEIEGLEPGQYSVMVEAEGHARAFSEPFTVAVGQQPPLLTVQMNEGGVIEGVLLASDGKPLAGATVSTFPNDYVQNPFLDMLGGLMPVSVTRTSVRTDQQGRFRLALLNEGTYQVKYEHAEHFDVFQKGLEVKTGQKLEVPVVRMAAGTVVYGTVRVDGVPAGQVKVSVTAVAEVGAVPFHCDVITDNQGKFQLGRRLPPGRYQITAARQTTSNVFQQVFDYQKTKQEFEVGGEQRQYSVDILIAGN